MIFLQNTSLFRSYLKLHILGKQTNKASTHCYEKQNPKHVNHFSPRFLSGLFHSCTFDLCRRLTWWVHDTRCARQREPLHASSAFAHGCTDTIALPSIKEELNSCTEAACRTLGLDFSICTFAFRKLNWALRFRYDFIKITQHSLYQRSCFEKWFLLVAVWFVCLLVCSSIVFLLPPTSGTLSQQAHPAPPVTRPAGSAQPRAVTQRGASLRFPYPEVSSRAPSFPYLVPELAGDPALHAALLRGVRTLRGAAAPSRPRPGGVGGAPAAASSSPRCRYRPL